MSADFETVEGLAFTRHGGLDIASWAVKGVMLQHEEVEIDAFACARVIDGARTYPRVLRLGLFKDESQVADLVWHNPRGRIAEYPHPRNIDDFSEFFRGEEQPWRHLISENESTSAIRGIYRAIVSGGTANFNGKPFRPVRKLQPDDLGTPPAYVHY